MRRNGSSRAGIIDGEYRKQKYYKYKRKEKCKERKCVECKYKNYCLSSEENNEI